MSAVRVAPELQLEEVGEQRVVPEAGAVRVDRAHERVRGLEVLQHPLAVGPAREQVP